MWKAWKDEKHVCVELTVLLGRGMNYEVRQPALRKCYDDGCGRRLKVYVEAWQRWVLSFPVGTDIVVGDNAGGEGLYVSDVHWSCSIRF